MWGWGQKGGLIQEGKSGVAGGEGGHGGKRVQTRWGDEGFTSGNGY